MAKVKMHWGKMPDEALVLADSLYYLALPMTEVATSPALYTQIAQVLAQARGHVRQTVNTTVQSYWYIGRLIVEDEQQDARRAE